MSLLLLFSGARTTPPPPVVTTPTPGGQKPRFRPNVRLDTGVYPEVVRKPRRVVTVMASVVIGTVSVSADIRTQPSDLWLLGLEFE